MSTKLYTAVATHVSDEDNGRETSTATAAAVVVDAEVVVTEAQVVEAHRVDLSDNVAQGTTQIRTNAGQLVSVLATPTGEIAANVPAYLEAQASFDQPKGITVTHDGDEMLIVQRDEGCERDCGRVFLSLFAVGWNVFMISFGVLSGAWGLYFILPHSWVGWFLAYFVMCAWLNSTHIIVNQHDIVVMVRPLNCCNTKVVVAMHDVKKIRCKRDIKYNKDGWTASYAVHVMDSSGNHKVIVEGLSTMEHAFFIQQELDKYYVTCSTEAIKIEEAEVNVV